MWRWLHRQHEEAAEILSQGSPRPEKLLEAFTGDIHRENLLPGRVQTLTEWWVVLRSLCWCQLSPAATGFGQWCSSARGGSHPLCAGTQGVQEPRMGNKSFPWLRQSPSSFLGLCEQLLLKLQFLLRPSQGLQELLLTQADFIGNSKPA